ncbi:unnamed protein product [Discosporangium mesarthrocarpum]
MPTYSEMVVEALLALKERTGSSIQAIKKHMTATHKDLNFTPHQLRIALRKGVESGKLMKIKSSYKLSPEAKTAAMKPVKPAAPKKIAPKKAAPKKPVAKSATPKKAAPKKMTAKPTVKKTAPKKAGTRRSQLPRRLRPRRRLPSQKRQLRRRKLHPRRRVL